MIPVVFKSPTDLHPHPLNRQMPRWAKDTEDWVAFVDDIRANGVQTPIRITAADEVVDGETRRLAAVSAGLSLIPCIVVNETEVAGTMLRELVLRRNLTKGQRAYLSVPLMETAVEESRKRRELNVTKGDSRTVDSVDDQANIGKSEDFARQFGFGRDLFFQARRIHDHFEANADLRSQFEPQILRFDDPIGLGACLAGIASVLESGDGKHGGGRPEDAGRQLELFTQTFNRDLKNRFEYWQRWDEDTRARAVATIAPALEAAPEDFLEALSRKIANERRRRKGTSDDD